MQRLCLVLLLLTSIAHAHPVRVNVFEKSTGANTNYWFEAESLALAKEKSGTISEIPQSSNFSLVNRKLMVDGIATSAADDILYQCSVDGFDLIVVRVEHNSFSNPFRWLTALSGHPIQVSTIYVLKIKDHEVLKRREIVHKPASYEWRATISQ